jgi:hypothetical protein
VKLTPFIAGLLLIMALAPFDALFGQQGTFTSPARGAHADREPGPAAPGGSDTFVPPDTVDSVEILGVAEEKPEASGRRRVHVRVKYTLTSYRKGLVSLGFNLDAATQFRRVSDEWVKIGSKELELSAVIAPVNWPAGQPFKVFVSLSAEPHPTQWSMLAAVTQAMPKAAGH